MEGGAVPIPRLRVYEGPALLSYGFRPFFLFGAIYAGSAILVWLLMFSGGIELASTFAPRDWHVHEMLYGFVPAIVTGFLLTAIPNWTGRLPLQGAPLLTLLGIWAAGRAAVTLSSWIGWIAAAVIDVAFLALVAAAAAREIVAGSNWRNLKVVAIIGALAAGNLIFHLEAHFRGSADYSVRLGIGAVILLISLVGGRVVPSFTHNWLARRQAPGRLPSPFGWFDLATVGATAAALILWIAVPFGPVTGAALIATGLMQFVRLIRWAGERTVRDRLVLVLHVGYAFVPLGFVLVGCAALDLLPFSAGIHAWTGGAVGTMTLAVMTRASLGHTGRELTASAGTQAIYAAVVVGALARICSSIHPDWFIPLLLFSGAAWAAAFLGFATLYALPLCSARRRSVAA
jgi:uncharacterized protein involved in response to NO